MSNKHSANVNIKFITKLKQTVTETIKLLCLVHGENSLSNACLFECHERFSEGRQEVEDDK
jgi:hypothetical protein